MEKIDMYGIPIQFYYNRKATFATFCGCWVSVFVILIIIAYIVLYSIDVSKRDFSFVVAETENLDFPPTYTFDRSQSPKEFSNNGSNYLDFMFGFKIRESNTWVTENSFSKYGLQLIIEQSNGTGSELEKLSYSECEDNHEEMQESFKNFNLNKTYCMLNDTFTLSGDRLLNKTDAEYIVVKVKKLENATSAELSKIRELDFYYIFSNYLISEDEPNKCLIPFFDWKIFELSSNSKVMALSYYQISKLSSYTNIIPKFMGPKGKKRYYAAFDENKYSVLQSSVDSDNIIAEIYIQSSDAITKYQRTYSNLFEILGYFGGFAQILFIIGAILVCYPASKTLEESIINDFYTIISPEYNKKVDYDFGKFLANLSEADGNIEQIKSDIKERMVETENNSASKNKKVKKKVESKEKDDEKLGIPGELGTYATSKRAAQLYFLGEYFRPRARKLLETHEKLENKNQKNAVPNDKLIDYKVHKILYTYYLNTIFSGLHYSCCDSFCNCICCCECVKSQKLKNKNKVFKKALFSLKKDTDFVSILKSISTFDAVKQSFLRENTQYCIFKSLSNKTYAQQYEDKRDKEIPLNDLTQPRTYDKLYDNVDRLKEHKEENALETDKRLLEEFSKGLSSEFIDEYIQVMKKTGGDEIENKDKKPVPTKKENKENAFNKKDMEQLIKKYDA